jgi:aryl-alcohol dehydrogenase-like predicted oxidoreductase
MEYRYLGRTGIKVSSIGLGCLQLGDKVGVAETVEIVARCLDLGINFFDTANSYSDGLSEEYLGKALGSRRREVVLATKVGRVRLGERRKMARDSSPAEIRSAIEASLRRLKTDYIDLYQIHWPDPDTPIEDTLGAMQDLVGEGKIRAVGVCNYSADQIRIAAAACTNLASLQSPYSMLQRELEVTTFPLCVRKGISVIPYRPLQQGMLAGRFTAATLPESASAVLRQHALVVAALRSYARALERPLAQVALAWLLAKPGVVSVIPGASRVAQVEENGGVEAWALSSSQVWELDRILATAGQA